MADAVVSALAQQLLDFTVKLIPNEVNLVRGLEKDLTDLADKLKLARKVLEDAEKKSYKNDGLRMWLNKLEATCYEMDDVLDKWDYNLLKQQFKVEDPPKHKVFSLIPSSSSMRVPFKKFFSERRIALKVEQVKVKLEEILKEKGTYDLKESEPNNHVDSLGRDPSTSFVDIGDICGRDDDRQILLSKLLGNEGTREEHLDIQIISIVGLGGIGKTTLAQLIYNDSQLEECYPLKIWICVSNHFDQFEIVKGIIQKITGSCRDANQLDLLLKHLKTAIIRKKFLLVLDDVWTEEPNKWEPLRNCLKFGGKGSKILVTTRNERVAKMMGTMHSDIHRVQVLSDDDCWSILNRIALFDRSESERENFEGIGKEIANKCKGLPLAAKVLGSLLRLKETLGEWEDIAKSQIWELEEENLDIFPHLILSYNELSPTLRRCFSYCGIFPEDCEIDVDQLINNWSALGYLGSNTDTKVRGRDCLNNLVMRSLFHGFKGEGIEEHVIKKCKVHDIVRDFARFIRKCAHDGIVKASCHVCSSTMISKVEEYRCSHYFDVEPPEVICECLASLRVLSMRRVKCLRGLEKLIHLRELNLTYITLSETEDLKAIGKLYHLKILTLRNCGLVKVSKAIENLTLLEHLDLSCNGYLREIPANIRSLNELRYFNISSSTGLSKLPKEIQKLTKLEILRNGGTMWRYRQQFPNGAVSHLIGLCELDEFNGKLSDLKKLNKLRGKLTLLIPELIGTEDDIKDAREAEMSKKEHLQDLRLKFDDRDEAGENGSKDWIWMGVLDALEPHQKLGRLNIVGYGGSGLPDWITSPLNQVKQIELHNLPKIVGLPALGKLPRLESLEIKEAGEMEHLGREFLGIISRRRSGNASESSPSSSLMPIAFPLLKELKFFRCKKWKEWEDITIEEEASSTTLSLFPSFQKLSVSHCTELKELPHRLLHKASSLRYLHIVGSTQLEKHYDKNDEGSAWNSISHISTVRSY